jgi:hypothetical protein
MSTDSAGARRLAPVSIRQPAPEKAQQALDTTSHSLSAENFVVAIPTHEHREHMLRCSRASRQVMTTCVQSAGAHHLPLS